MKFPHVSNLTRSFASRTFVLAAIIVATTIVTFAQKSDGFVPENDSATLQQCRNGATAAAGPQCIDGAGGEGWVPGNAGNSNSHWEERQFISYRMLFGGLSAGSNTVVIGYDFIHSGKHAIDYLGTYNATELDSDPCSGVTGCSALATDTAPTPLDPSLPATVPQIPGVFTIWGATFDSDPVFVPCGVANESLVRCVQISFTPNAGVTAPVLAWGGHIAWRAEWGAGQSAGGISGSPYHMRLEELNGSGGNQDRSLSADAVFGPGSLRIIKSVATFGGGNSSTVEFFFTASQGFSPSSFSLVDDNTDPGVDTKLSDPISDFNGTTNVITVTENTALFPAGNNWSLANISCTESVSTVGTSPSVPLARVTVTVDPEEVVVCTFHNTQFAPTAATASVSGRAVDSFGYGIGGARITVMDAVNGDLYNAITNPFGYYTIEGLGVGNFYVTTISSKRYQFTDDTRTFTLQDDLTGIDFIANP